MITIIDTIKEVCKETSIPYPLYESMIVKYFIGQTPFLPTNSNSLLVALVNPKDSKVNIFLNVATITALQAIGLVEFYLGYSYISNRAVCFYCLDCWNCRCRRDIDIRR